MRRERRDRRILGAVRFVDFNTGLPTPAPLTVRAPDVRFMRNRRGFYVIAQAPQLTHHLSAFERPPADPDPGSAPIVLQVSDPTGQYLPRQATVELPLDPDPANADTGLSLFRAQDVGLLPGPGAPMRANLSNLSPR